MNLIETNIPDVIPKNVDMAKQVLADNIISNVYPLFDDIYATKVQDIEELKNIINKQKDEINQDKIKLEEMIENYNRNKKVSKLLNLIERLVTSGLVYDGSIKNEMIVLLKVITKLSNEKIDSHLKDTLRIISKRFSK